MASEMKALLERLEALEEENRRLREAAPPVKARVRVAFSKAGNATFYVTPKAKGYPPMSGAVALDDLSIFAEVEKAVRALWKANSACTVQVAASKKDSTGRWFRDDNDVTNVAIPKYRD